MPRFFFHLHDDLDVPDTEGVELPGWAEAGTHAAEEARTMAAECVRQGRLVLDHRIEVADEHGNVVLTVRFADAVEVLP